ncbi:glutamyl-tRNA reductase [Salinispira pacifica]
MTSHHRDTEYLRAARYFCAGISHRSAPLELLEKCSLQAGELAGRLRSVLDGGCSDCSVEEVVLSTCNRLEFYWARSEADSCRSSERQMIRLRELVDELSAGADGAFYLYKDEEAAAHLFRVASGLDSAVLGEFEIQGQTTAALAAATDAGAAGPLLTELFQSALRSGKRARAETGIGRNASSVSSVAVQLASGIVPDLASAQVTIVGAGETGELTLKSLVHRGAARVAVVNRTRARAEALAARWGGSGHAMSELEELLARTDILITAARTTRPFLDPNMVRRSVVGRSKDAPLAIIDIGVPRNVDPAVAEVEEVHLFDVETIKSTHQKNRRRRQNEVPKVEAIIREELEQFRERVGELLMRPLLAGFWKRAESIREEVMDGARRQLSGLRSEEWDRIDAMARSLVKRLLQTPARRLRDEAGSSAAPGHAAAIGHLFDIVPEAGRYRQCRHASDESPEEGNEDEQPFGGRAAGGFGA